MTDRVRPSLNAPGKRHEVATTISMAGGADPGFVADGTVYLADEDSALSSGALNAFDATASGASLDVTIDAGESFVGGAWVCRDVSTTVTLDGSTTGQTVSLGWDKSARDTVIIGLAAAFNSYDRKIPLYDFDTDGSGVTTVTDRRILDTDGTGMGINFVQNTEPEYTERKTWVNPAAGIYFGAYDAGGGGDWHPIPPVTVLDEAATFDESGLTLTHNKTEEIGGKIHLKAVEPSGNQTSMNPDTTQNQTDAGVAITANTNMAGVRGRIDNSGYFTSASSVTVELWSTSGTLLASNSYGSVGGGDWVEVEYDLQTGTKYHFGIDVGSSQAFPDTGTGGGTISGTDIDINEGVFDLNNSSTTTSHRYTWNRIESMTAVTSGDVLVEWPSPSDIDAWDLATWQKTLDGETVDVDVEDGSGIVLYSDIPQNFDISPEATSTNISLRARLSRASGSNDPSIDYLARRYVR